MSLLHKSAPFLLAVCALAAAHGQARSDTTDLAKIGAWTVYAGTSTSDTPLCGIAVNNADYSQSFHIKHFKGNPHFTVQVFKKSWDIPEGSRVNVAFRIDSNTSWTAKAFGERTKLEWTIGLKSLDDFITEFRLGANMRISFPDGTETDWVASLTGRCIRTLTLPSAAGQPYRPDQSDSPTAPSQPFQPRQPAAPPPPTQTPYRT